MPAVDITQVPTEQLQQMLQPTPSPAGTVQPATAGPDITKIPTEQLQSMLQPQQTSVGSKVLAGAAGAARGMIEGAAQVAAAPEDLISGAIQGGLDLLNKAGIVPDSMKNNFAQSRVDARNAAASMGKSALDTVFGPAQQEAQDNPNITKYSNMAGNAIGSTIGAGAIIGDAGKGLSAINKGVVNQGAQGLLLGASGNPNNPWVGGAIGAGIGGVLGGVAGHFDRSVQIINDKIDDAERIGMSPMSEVGIKSIKGALDNGGKELTTEEVEKATKQAIVSKLESVAPKVDITEKPTDMITNLAMKNYPDVIKQQDALYQPLHDAEGVVETPKITSALAAVKDKKVLNLLPDDLTPNPTIDDLLNYRRDVSQGINQAERAIKMGNSQTANGQTFKQLIDIKSNITDDLNAAASKVGLGDQLQKADQFHINEVKPFDVYNTDSGKLLSPEDATDVWTRVSKLLRPKLPNLTAMEQTASTLGPQGKQIFGYAYLQQAVERAGNIDERTFPNKLSTEFNKLQNSGLALHILTPELQEAFQGVRNIAEGALKTTKMGGAPSGAIMNFINKATHTSVGINMLRAAGSKTTPVAKLKNVIGQILTNAAEKGAGSLTEDNSQTEQQ